MCLPKKYLFSEFFFILYQAQWNVILRIYEYPAQPFPMKNFFLQTSLFRFVHIDGGAALYNVRNLIQGFLSLKISFCLFRDNIHQARILPV